MSIWTVIAVASSVGKAYATLYSAAATKASMDAQADISALQFKEKRIEYKEQGVEALKETNKALGTIVARGAAGGALTNEGSILTSQIVSLREGAEDYSLAALNQELTQNLGIIQFNNYKIAGKQAKKMGYLNAIFGLGTDIGKMGSTGSFDKKPDKTEKT
tara:strand:- start:161 stop:643 length:483 start_codon:yes stop_codon:yes gene_type:complete